MGPRWVWLGVVPDPHDGVQVTLVIPARNPTVIKPNQMPNAEFDFELSDLTVNFDGSASSDADGNIVSYAWDFGDGNIGSGVTPAHVYGSEGTFSVALVVTDDDGAKDTATKQVTVTAPSAGREYPDGEPFVENELRVVGTPGDANGDGIWEEIMRLLKTNWQFDTVDLELYRVKNGQSDFIPGNWFQFSWASNNAPDAAWDSDGTFYSQYAAVGFYDFVMSLTLKTSPDWYLTSRSLKVEVYETHGSSRVTSSWDGDLLRIGRPAAQ